MGWPGTGRDDMDTGLSAATVLIDDCKEKDTRFPGRHHPLVRQPLTGNTGVLPSAEIVMVLSGYTPRLSPACNHCQRT